MYCMRCGGAVDDVPVVRTGEATESARCARCRLHYTRTPGLAVPPHDTQVLSRTTPLHCRRESTDLVCASCGSHCEVVTFQRGLLRTMVARCGNCALTAVDALDRDPLRAMVDGLLPAASTDEPPTAPVVEGRKRDLNAVTQPMMRAVKMPTANAGAAAPKANDLATQLTHLVAAFVLTDGPA